MEVFFEFAKMVTGERWGPSVADDERGAEGEHAATSRREEFFFGVRMSATDGGKVGETDWRKGWDGAGDQGGRGAEGVRGVL